MTTKRQEAFPFIMAELGLAALAFIFALVMGPIVYVAGVFCLSCAGIMWWNTR